MFKKTITERKLIHANGDDFREGVIFISVRSINFLTFQEIEEDQMFPSQVLASPTQQHAVKCMEEIVS